MSRGLPFAANPLLDVRLPAYRSKLVMLMIALAFIALVARAVYLQVITNEFLQRQGEVRYGRTVELPASRGKMLDRNGIVLASSLPARAVWASPEDLRATPAQLAELAQLLQMPPRELQRLVADEDKTFVYLKRQVEADVAVQVEELGIAGVHQRKEYKRYYPEGEALAHVVGFTNVEDVGQEGMELSQQPRLAGQPGSRRVLRDRLGRTVEDVGLIREPRDGRDLQLSIDTKIQYHAFAALRDAVVQNRAKAGAVVVLDVHTGEVLALANLPTYDPNDRDGLSGARLRNRVITDTFEPGSTLKPFAILVGLESGKYTPQTMVDTAPGYLTIGNRTIHDAHAHGALTVEQVLQKSSNIGTAKIALSMPAQRMWEMYAAAGVADPAGARLHDVRAQRRHRADLDDQGQRGRARGAGGESESGGGSPKDARDGDRSGRNRAAGAGSRLPGGREDRDRLQAGRRALRQEIHFLVRRLRAGLESPPGGRGDDRRALRRPVLRWNRRRAGVLEDRRRRPAHPARAARRPAGRADDHGRTGTGEHVMSARRPFTSTGLRAAANC